MPASGRPVRFRVLRLLATLAVVTALAAIASIVNGGSASKGKMLVIAAVTLGAVALAGMGLSAWRYIKKAKNDPRP